MTMFYLPNLFCACSSFTILLFVRYGLMLQDSCLDGNMEGQVWSLCCLVQSQVCYAHDLKCILEHMFLLELLWLLRLPTAGFEGAAHRWCKLCSVFGAFHFKLVKFFLLCLYLVVVRKWAIKLFCLVLIPVLKSSFSQPLTKKSGVLLWCRNSEGSEGQTNSRILREEPTLPKAEFSMAILLGKSNL